MRQSIRRNINRQFRMAGKIFRKRPIFFVFIYCPVILYIITYLALKARSLSFITLVNPSIRFGGLIGNSKFQLNQKFESNLIPKAVMLKANETLDSLKIIMSEQLFSYPIILKPDMGEGGVGVSLIKSDKEAEAYLNMMKGEIILEEYIDTIEEYAILYCRLPHQQQGRILSFAQKEFLKLHGDGVSSIKELMEDERFDFNRKKLQKKLGTELQTILSAGEEKIITKLGNCKDGVICKNLNNIITKDIVEKIDDISHSIDGFYFGRFDIRTNSLEDLKNGNFKIIELNGVNAIPLHIYDPHIPFLQCYKDLFKHWNLVCKIAIANRDKGIPSTTAMTVIREFLKMRYQYFFYPSH